MIDYVLKYSLIEHKPISIIYMKKFEIVKRNIQVLKIENKVIKAIDIDKKEIRIFKKDRILSAMDSRHVIQHNETKNKNKEL
ncbi:hypothetical protein [Thermohalobacter berrensis]|uniref:Uncharacterized protein n=1 Tax=Thermohalobacter berrensis TaxID=99594 RepID=A0A419T6Y0_9FIRM|nr:hypothetical protein [Thermohalobacter berrensis]RKD33163.1 hypothetical protein BET03_09600 [Thermohalobacter berrensis]